MDMTAVVEETLASLSKELTLSNPLETLADVLSTNHLARVRARSVISARIKKT